jgi:hypothetical protein
MSEKEIIKKETLDTDIFWSSVVKYVQEGMEHRDAIDMTAAVMGGEYAVLASQAVGKYQEATHPRMELSKEQRVDEYALASMGELWHGENFEGSTVSMKCSVEEVFCDSIYFILKYVEEYGNNALKEALKANQNVCGDKVNREAMIRLVLW